MKSFRACLEAVSIAVLSVAVQAQTIERVRLSDNDLNCAQIYAEVQQMEQLSRMGNPVPSPVPGAVPVQQPQATVQSADLGAVAALLGGTGARVPVAAGAGGMTLQNAQVQQMMLASNDPRVRAAASDPAMVAQTAAMLQNPQMAVAAQRAAAAGVNPALIQSQVSAVTAAQQMAGGQVPPAQPAAGLGGLFGALSAGAANRGGANAGLFGGLANAAATAQPAVATPAAPVTMPMPAPTAQMAPGLAAQAHARKEHLTQMFLARGCKLSELTK